PEGRSPRRGVRARGTRRDPPRRRVDRRPQLVPDPQRPPHVQRRADHLRRQRRRHVAPSRERLRVQDAGQLLTESKSRDSHMQTFASFTRSTSSAPGASLRIPLLLTTLLGIGLSAACGSGSARSESAPAGTPASIEILNVSYDPTRELYAEFNAAFARHWQARTNQTVTIRQSHGGSGAQARPDRNSGGAVRA